MTLRGWLSCCLGLLGCSGLGSAGQALAQGAVQQSGVVLPGHIATWAANGLIRDGGVAGGGGGGGGGGSPFTSLTVNSGGLGICQYLTVGGATNLCTGFVGATPTISTTASTLNIVLGGITYSLPSAFGSGGGGGGGSGGGTAFLPLAGGVMTGVLNAGAGLTVGARLTMGDNINLVLSTNGVATLGYSSTSNAVVVGSSALQPSLGIQFPDGQGLTFNVAGTARMYWDTTLSRLRVPNVITQFDAGLSIPGGGLMSVGGVIQAAGGISVTGGYAGAAAEALDLSGVSLAAGAVAIRLPDGAPIAFTTDGKWQQFATSAAPFAIAYDGTTLLSMDTSGNVTLTGNLSSGGTITSPVFGALTLAPSSGTAVLSVSTANGGNGNLFVTTANATGLLRLAANANGLPMLDLDPVASLATSYQPLLVTGALTVTGDYLGNSATTLANGATSGFLHLPHTAAAPTGTPSNTTPGCEWNTGTHVLNCFDNGTWYHINGTSGAG